MFYEENMFSSAQFGIFLAYMSKPENLKFDNGYCFWLKLWNSTHVKASNITTLVCFEKFQILIWKKAMYYRKYYLAENLAALFFNLAESSRILPSFYRNFPTSSWHHW